MSRTPATPKSADLTGRLGELVTEVGAAAWGVTTAQPFGATERDLRLRIEDGTSAALTFTYTDPGTATDVYRSFPWAQSLFVVAWPYLPSAGRPGLGTAGTGRIARFATQDHYAGLQRCLSAAAGMLEAAGWAAESLSDDNRLVDRAAAVRAGVGWWGKNAMVLNPKHGPWLLLGTVVTDAELAPSEPMQRDCGSCDACRPACPTGALVAPGILDARLCLARWLQARGTFPRHLRSAVGDRVYGCDDCLDACPPGAQSRTSAIDIRGRVDLVALLGTPDDELLATYGHFYIPKRNPNVLRRNALIALGNTGGPDHLDVLAGYAGHPDAMLRAHAIWALAELDGATARMVIEEVGATERHAEVLEEIEAALA